MSMKKWKDLAVATVDERAESGKRWHNVGVLLRDDDDPDRVSIRLNTIPIGWTDGWISAFEPRESGGAEKAAPKPAAKKPAPQGDLVDDIPF